MRSLPRLLLLLLPAVLLAGCASTGSVPSTARVPAPAPTGPVEAGSGGRYGAPVATPYRPPAQVAQARPQPAKAVRALLERARKQQAAGDLVGAANTLERAVRIEPGNALVWNRLAHVRLEQGRYTQAAGLAAKSKALAGGDAVLKADNDRIIARANAHR
ncbi:MAG TPA: tetratricopeptide repeat protein [Thiolapillus brandeum]|uniref:Tetratricopeptide repeat protein n=1 Tax=Thiolapillus brandeum TaxID=1076588 RepID=A0A7C5IZR4_9GAMM|nr:tetratricopeptide repeat protein [Thiolapillus brandeum]